VKELKEFQAEARDVANRVEANLSCILKKIHAWRGNNRLEGPVFSVHGRSTALNGR
jgi:hypothetical protein